MNLKVLRFAAIDIGSNAIRLLISNVIETSKGPYFKKVSLIRVPIRLGRDVFETGKITAQTEEKLMRCMIAFQHLIQAEEVITFRAVATSAMREAENQKQIASRIEKESHIKIEVIDGQEEARLIYAIHSDKWMAHEATSLYVDVGGGSTEISFIASGKLVDSRSFKIGTLRALQNKIEEEEWQRMKMWLKQSSKIYQPSYMIGTGGNINKYFKISGAKKNDAFYISKEQLKDAYESLKGMTIEQRIRKYSMNPDRADVIIPAGKIFLSIMKWVKASRVYVPKLGLADGMIRTLYDENQSKKSP